jgi:subtilase family serine protease
MTKTLKKSLIFRLAIVTTMLAASSFSGTYEKNISTAAAAWNAQPYVQVKRFSSSGPVGYTPAQIRNAYGVDKIAATGSGQTIAIVDAYGDPTIQNDLDTFCTQFGLPKTTVTIAYPSGKPSTTNGGWALETAMDVEWAHAIAPSAKILVVVAKTASTANLVSAIDYASSNGAQVVSNSWGGSEFSGEVSYDSHFQHAGVTYLASSGDNGAGASWPASSPYVQAVGGTTLNIDSTGAYLSETAWSGSGGAKSSYESSPTYQSNWASVVGTRRGAPDIAWDADPNTGVAVYSGTPYNGSSGWFQVGGTSLSAPSWAGVVALINQTKGSNFASFDEITKLYTLAGTTGSSGYTTNFHDITSGSNGNSASSGYDLVTGLGSPKVDVLVGNAAK